MKLIAAFFISMACLSHAALADEDDDDFTDIHVFKTRNLSRSTVDELRKGGYVLYMRHGNTDTSRPDAIQVNLNDCTTQRMLSKEGRRIVTEIGHKLRKAKIPLGEVYSSPMCRAKETAELAFGNKYIVNNLLRYTANMNDKEKFKALETIRELISDPVTGHSNRVIVAHSQNIMALLGYLPSPEGTIVIFQPLGDHQFKYIASVKPDQWGKILP
jgi:phosphohistidine phosphatase SixA